MAELLDTAELVPGRSCQGCTMCCKLMEVDALGKPRGAWCGHCDQKRGCTIYETRPDACRIFYCGYLRIPMLDERWKPSKAKFLVNYESPSNRIVIHVDPARPGAWREEPFHAQIKRWAASIARDGGFLVVWTGQSAVAVLPGREKDLGQVRDDQLLLTSAKRTASGVVFDVIVVDADDPRAQKSS